MGNTKQAASRLIDVLVVRGYLGRHLDPGDRRRMTLALTGRGESAHEAAQFARDEVESRAIDQIGEQSVHAARETLAAVAGIGVNAAGVPAPTRVQFSAISTIFPVLDIPAALKHYALLGLEVEPYIDGTDHGFANRSGIGLQFERVQGHDPKRSTPGIGGRSRRPTDTEYGLREGAHIDPDGNLIRYGSWLADS